MPAAYRVSAVPATIGVVLLGTAIYLQIEHSITSGHLTSTDALQPAITLAVAVAGVISHHRLANWRLVSGVLFALLALIGSGVVVYSTLSRTATARDLQATNAMASGRQLADLGVELERTRALAQKECRIVGPRCQSMQARVDKLIADMSGLRSVSADPRADALVRLAELLGADGARVRAIVAALDPVILPLFLEAGCILFFAAAFPHRRQRSAADPRTDAGITQVLTQVSERPLNTQEWAAVWNVHPTTAGRRLKRMEAAGQLRRQREGRSVLALPAPR